MLLGRLATEDTKATKATKATKVGCHAPRLADACQADSQRGGVSWRRKRANYWDLLAHWPRRMANSTMSHTCPSLKPLLRCRASRVNPAFSSTRQDAWFQPSTAPSSRTMLE